MNNYFLIIYIITFKIINSIVYNESVIFIDKTLLNYTSEKCLDNPFLTLLPKKLRRTLTITLSKKPKKNNLNFCHNENSGKTCCTKFTKKNVHLYLTDYIFTPRQNIYDKNIFYYKRLFMEHKRNILKGFKLSLDIYEKLFHDFQSHVKNLVEINERIVRMSVQYTWNNICNYICNFHDSLKNCKIYAVRYKINDKMLYDYEFNCKMNKYFFNNFTGLIQKFREIKFNLNNTIEGFYKNIFKESDNIVKNLLNEENYILYNNSLNDGLYVSKTLNQRSLCYKENITTLTNYYLNGTLITINTDCESLIKKPCGLFNCLDSFYLQFFYQEEHNGTNIIYLFNYTKTNMTPTDVNDMVYFNFTSDIQDLIKHHLTFVKAHFIYLNFYFIFICFVLILF